MQKQPLISFIIPVYNTDSDALRNCIDSIMALSLSEQEREIIIIDDGSDMTPLNTLADIADQILYIRQRNQGPSLARNAALKMATGQYVQFISGDDMLLRAPYEHCLDIARYHNPDVVLYNVTTDATSTETPFTYDGPKLGSDFLRNKSLRPNTFCFLFERKALGNIRFSPDIYHDNEYFATQMLLRSERLYTTDSDAYYNSRTHSLASGVDSQSRNARLFADTEQVLMRLQNLVVPESERAALNRRIAQITVDYLCSIIRLTHDRHLLNDTIERLRNHGFYPLPDRDYSKKYKYYRKMLSNPITRRMLFFIVR